MSTPFTAKDLLVLIDKYMYSARDFEGEFIKAPSKDKLYECPNFFRVCGTSKEGVKREFNIPANKTIVACVINSGEGADGGRAYYVIKPKGNANVKPRDIRVVEFTKEQAAQAAQICRYKKQFNGRGEDPKCQ